MALLNIRAIIEKVHTLLRDDVRTSYFTWHFGRRSPDQVKEFPAGIVSLGTGIDYPVSIPKGREGQMFALILLRFKDDRGIEDAERQMYDGLDVVLEVLADKRNLGLTYVMFHKADELVFDSDPDVSPAWAQVLIRLRIIIRA